MLLGKRIAVVLPAYRAEQTLARTYTAIPHDIVDRVLLVDDASRDGTVQLALSLGIDTFVHVRNLGYGANQKTCYREALKTGADVVIMVHPDYQYEPRLIAAMAAMVIASAPRGMSGALNTRLANVSHAGVDGSRRASPLRTKL